MDDKKNLALVDSKEIGGFLDCNTQWCGCGGKLHPNTCTGLGGLITAIMLAWVDGTKWGDCNKQAKPNI